jgi:hypothetical protein
LHQSADPQATALHRPTVPTGGDSIWTPPEVRTQDYLARGVQFIEKVPDLIVRSVQAIACAVLGWSETL